MVGSSSSVDLLLVGDDMSASSFIKNLVKKSKNRKIE